MVLNTFGCNYLTPLHFEGLTDCRLDFPVYLLQSCASCQNRRTASD